MNRLKRQLNHLSVAHVAFILFMISILLGVLIANVFRGSFASMMLEYQNSIFPHIVESDIDRAGLFRFTLVNNLKELFIYWILCITILGVPYIAFKIGVYGFSLGFFVSVVTMQYGLKGILLVVVYAFPHGLLYIPIGIISLSKGFRLCRTIYHESRNYMSGIRDAAKGSLLLIVVLGVLLMIGSFLEAYAGSYLLKKTLEIFT